MQALSCIVIVICIPTEHLRVHNNSLKRVRAFKIELEFGNIVFLGERKTGVPREKPLGGKERTNNKLNPHNDVDARIRTWATLVGGECSHHYAILQCSSWNNNRGYRRRLKAVKVWIKPSSHQQNQFFKFFFLNQVKEKKIIERKLTD